MPSKFTSPYGTSFTNGVKNGTPCSTVVCNIAKKTGKSTSTIYQSLYKAGLCFGQKVGGTWVYWPTFTTNKKFTSTTKTNTTNCMWQSFVDWCMTSGCCTPTQLNNKSTSQKKFVTYCKNFFGKTVTGTKTGSAKMTKRRTTTTKKNRKTTSWHKNNWTKNSTKKYNTTSKRYTGTKNRKNTTTSWNRTGTVRSYKFPTFKSRTTSTRRYVRAA
jgi:hypothetical protein